MGSTASSYCQRAVAYLKVALPPNAEVHLELAERDSPVVRSLGHKLAIFPVRDSLHIAVLIEQIMLTA
jgi:hypothetical protein